MDLREFYRLVLPSRGRYVLFQNKRNTLFDDFDDFVAETEARGQGPQDLYFATATFGKEDNRQEHNALLYRCLRTDIDCGVDKFARSPATAYPTLQDAGRAVAEFVSSTKLKPTFYVLSGYGLHLYWCLDTDLSLAEWKPLATALKAALKHGGVRTDQQVTANPTLVLRPPGSVNLKRGTTAPVRLGGKVGAVYSVAEMRKLLIRDLPETTFAYDTSINDDVVPVYRDDGAPHSIEKIAATCQQVQWFKDSQGDTPEPHWRGVAGLAKSCGLDQIKIVAEWSSGKFDPQETIDKAARWNAGPTKCETFEDANPGGCDGCQYRGRIVTPRTLGKVVEDEPPVPGKVQQFDVEALDPDEAAEYRTYTGTCPIPDRPDLFDKRSEFHYRMEDGAWTLYHCRPKKELDPTTGKEGWVKRWHPVLYRLLWVGHAVSAVGNQHTAKAEVFYLPRASSTEPEHVPLDMEKISEARDVAAWLHGRGILLELRDPASRLSASIFLSDGIRRVNEAMRAVVRDHFGFQYHEGELVCAIGNVIVYPDRSIRSAMVLPHLTSTADEMMPQVLPPLKFGQDRHEPGIWSSHVRPGLQHYQEFLRKHYGHEGFETARLAIMLGLASPMMAFVADSPLTHGSLQLPASGFVVSLLSKASGKGKSSLQESIALGYGRPGMKRSGASHLNTANAMIELAGQTGSFPYLLDEVTGNEADATARLVETLANGTAKQAMNARRQVRPTLRWANISIVSTNVPQREMMMGSRAARNTNALAMRLLELDFDRQPETHNPGEFMADFKETARYSGAFGLALCMRAVSLGEDKLALLANECVKRAFEVFGDRGPLRFFVRALASVFMMEELLSARGMPFSVTECTATMAALVKVIEETTEAHVRSPLDQLDQFLSHISRNTAVTHNFARRGHRERCVLLNQQPPLPLHARQVNEEGIVYVRTSALREWCREQRLSSSSLMAELEHVGALRKSAEGLERRVALAAGLDSLPASNPPCLTIDLDVLARHGLRPTEGDNVVQLARRDGGSEETADDAASAL